MIRFAVIGTNTITDKFLQAASALPDFKLCAVYSRTLARAREYAQKNNVSLVFDSLEALADSDQIDAVYIASPNFCHAAQSILMMQHHKHVLCEKPIASNTSEFQQMYDTAIKNQVILLEAMRSVGVKRLIFSSSSTVYGTPQHLPLTEAEPTGEATNPYGRTKIHIEEILADLCRSDSEWSVVCLRYFNPIGAHPSGLIGEDPNGIPNNLLPYIARVASGRLPYLNVFGNDYDTPDGTGVRDFFHVVDLAQGHTDALPYAVSHTGWIAVNLGCGRGYSVLEVVKAFEDASGRRIPLHFAPRRAGDIAANWCDPTLALKLFGWKAKFGIEDMCRDSWHFESLLKTECETR